MKGFIAGTRGAFFLALVTALGLGMASPALAQEKNTLPAFGTFKIHSGWKGVGENFKVGENHVFGTGNFWVSLTMMPAAGRSIWEPSSAPTRSI
jgi:hypothetical protein